MTHNIEVTDMTKKTIFTHVIMSLAIVVPLTFTAANAGGEGNILDQSIYDYSDSGKAAFKSSNSDLEQAEFAASENYSSDKPSEQVSSDSWMSESY